MARKQSTSGRLERLQAEAEITEREKEEKRKAKAAAPAKKPAKKTAKKAVKRTRAVKAPARMMVVWAVCGPKGGEVSVFRFPHKAAADAECAELTDSTGKQHTVQRKKVPLE